MLPAAAVDPVLRFAGAAAGARRHRHRRRQLLLPRRYPPRGELKPKGLHYVDVGVSGGVWGLERGYCHMIGGEDDDREASRPDLPLTGARCRSGPAHAGRGRRARQAEQGYLHCGPNGAGHFVKMVHNGIEYGMMAAFAEGFNIIRHANVGLHDVTGRMPRRHRCAIPDHYQYDIDVAKVAEVWRRGSVVASWLFDLDRGRDATGSGPGRIRRPRLGFRRRALDAAGGDRRRRAGTGDQRPRCIPASQSRGNADFADRILSAMRFAFGGHVEKKA